MEWTTTINLGGFGNSAEMEWQTVKSWQSFTDFFEDAVHIDAVTYCESPEFAVGTVRSGRIVLGDDGRPGWGSR